MAKNLADKSNISLTIVVVTYNNQDTICKCIDHIINSVNGFRSEIVIIDNSSNDRTLEIIRKYNSQINIVQLKKNIGFGSANNIAFKSYQSDYYILVNSDAYLNKRSIMDLVSAFTANEKMAIAGPPLIFPDLTPQSSAYAKLSFRKKLLQALGLRGILILILKIPIINNILKIILESVGQKSFAITFYQNNRAQKSSSEQKLNKSLKVDWLTGAVMAIKQEAIEKCGGFDPNFFMYYEDEDLCRRMQYQGYEIRLVNTDPVVHDYGWGKAKKFKALNEERIKSAKYFVDKHFRNQIITHAGLRFLIKTWPRRW